MARNPSGLCQCGCGETTSRTPWKVASEGYEADEHRLYVHGHHFRGQGGPTHPLWRGGRYRDKKGYILVWVGKEHPLAKSNGHAREHRLVMSQTLGRWLRRDETVHHKNGIRDDNRPENLELRVGAHGNGATHHCPTCTCTEGGTNNLG